MAAAIFLFLAGMAQAALMETIPAKNFGAEICIVQTANTQDPQIFTLDGERRALGYAAGMEGKVTISKESSTTLGSAILSIYAPQKIKNRYDYNLKGTAGVQFGTSIDSADSRISKISVPNFINGRNALQSEGAGTNAFMASGITTYYLAITNHYHGEPKTFDEVAAGVGREQGVTVAISRSKEALHSYLVATGPIVIAGRRVIVACNRIIPILVDKINRSGNIVIEIAGSITDRLRNPEIRIYCRILCRILPVTLSQRGRSNQHYRK